MSRVVTERPRRGHGNRNEKFGGRLTRREIDRECHDDITSGPSGLIAWSRHRNKDSKSFTDLLGPLRGYLRKQVGRPWDAVWSELSANLDRRSLTGIHIFGHVTSEVEIDCWQGVSGRIYARGRFGLRTYAVDGLYVHPFTKILCWQPRRQYRERGSQRGPFLKALRDFPGVTLDGKLRRYRIDGLRLWERRDAGWFISTYRQVPERIEMRETWRRDGTLYPQRIPAHREIVSTKQASRKEMSRARALLEIAPF